MVKRAAARYGVGSLESEVIGLGEMGIGKTTSSAAVLAAITGANVGAPAVIDIAIPEAPPVTTLERG